MRRRPRATSSSRLALVAGWALLALAWAVANPPFAAPDEASHFVRAVGIGQGHLIGTKPPASLEVGGTPRQQAWVRQLVRDVSLPRGLDPRPFDCVRDPRASAACQHTAPSPATSAVTDVGPYQPLPYVAPGLAARTQDTATKADRAARLAALAVNLALLAAAAWLVSGLLGLALAVTPMVLFLGASVTSSGFEVAAGVAFAAAVLRVARADVGRAERIALALTGVALALSRTPGPLWVALDLALGAALAGPKLFARRSGPVALGAIVAAIAANRIWEHAHGPSASVDLHGGAGEAVRQAWRAAPQLVGRFGYLEWRLPAWIPVLWLAALAALVVIALTRTSRKRLLGGAVLAAALLVPAFQWVALRGTGFSLQGRHVLPILVAIPLLAGELLPRAPRRLIQAAAAAVALAQFAAFAYDARRAATGVDGPLLFLGKAEWSPPGGWVLWLLVAAAGALTVGLATAVSGPPAARPVGTGSTLGGLLTQHLPSNQES